MKKRFTFIVLAILAFTISSKAQYLDEGFESGIPGTWSEDGSVAWSTSGGSCSSCATSSKDIYDAHTGSLNAIFYSSALETTKLITPVMDLSGAINPELRFWHAQEAWGSDQDELRVYYSTTSASGPWILIPDFFWTNDISEWTEESVLLPNPSATYYIAFQGTADYGLGVIIDDIVVQNTVSCLTPVELASANATVTTADLSWNDIAGALSWNVEVMPTGITPAGTPTYLGVTNPFTADGLLPSSTYDFYVQADCGSGDTSPWSEAFTFGTSCGATILPWSEGFEGTADGELPNCFFTADAASEYDWEIGFETESTTEPMYDTYKPNSGTNFVNFDNGWPYYAYLYTPAFDLTAGVSYDFSAFYVVQNSNSSYPVDIEVFYSSSQDTSDTKTIINTYGASNIDYSEMINTFTPAVSGIYYIGVYVIVSVNNSKISFDDLSMQVTPTCEKPDGLTVGAITTTTADITWVEQATATLWNVQYGSVGFTLGSGTTVIGLDLQSYSITGLTGSTEYDVYAQADCGGGDLSNWRGPVSFTTECAAYTVPWTENFDSMDIPLYGSSQELPACMSKDNFISVKHPNNEAMWEVLKARSFDNNVVFSAFPSHNTTLYSVSLDLTGGVSYDFSAWYRTWSSTNGGSDGLVNVKLFWSPSNDPAVSVNYIDGASVSYPVTETYAELIGSFVPAESGIYYVGIEVGASQSGTYPDIAFDDLSLTVTPGVSLLTWSPSPLIFEEDAVLNNGSIPTTGNVVLSGETFVVTSGLMTEDTHYSVTNLPAGLTIEVNTTDANNVTISLTGAAGSHNDADDVLDFTIEFLNAAFAGGSAVSVTNFSKNDMEIDFIEMNHDTDFLAYTVPGQTGPSIINTVAHTIQVMVPYSTDLTDLIATFNLSDGATAVVGSTDQISGTTSNDFSGIVTYTVTAEDGFTSQNWLVTIMPEPADDGTDFLTYSVTGQIGFSAIDYDNHTVTAEVANGTGLTNLVATFTLSAEGTIAEISSVLQESGITANDFTNTVTYLVTAENGIATQEWNVTITEEFIPEPGTDILTYNIPQQVSAPTINAVNHTVGVIVPQGTDVTALVATFTLSTGATATVSGETQFSGSSANDFTNTVTYIITADDGTTTQEWTVTVIFAGALNDETDILTFSLPEQTGDATMDATVHAVDIEVANGADLANLISIFTLSDGANAEVSGVSQISGVTVNNFFPSLTYTVIAEDGITTQNWNIKISIASTAINELGLNTEMVLYPNPNNGQFNVYVKFIDNEDITLDIIDVQGRVIYTKKHNNVSILNETINIEDYSKGIYFLRIQSNKINKIEKIVVN